ncbi:MAG: cadherin repeat domain-containing protein [Phormidesmis sp.]
MRRFIQCVAILGIALSGCNREPIANTGSTDTDASTDISTDISTDADVDAIAPPRDANIAQTAELPTELTITAPQGNPPENSAFIQVAENIRSITQVVAEDAPGQKLIYRLQDGEDKDHFELNEETGALSFVQAPDWENPADADQNNNYMLLWQVISSSGEARSQFLVIQVTDLPD